MIRQSLLITSLTLLVAVAVSAQPIEWPVADGGNGHWYEYVEMPGILWEAAYLGSQLFNEGLQAWGYMAAIETAEENAWILANLQPGNAWIGLQQALAQPPLPPCGFEPDQGWYWVDVPTPMPMYTNWCSGQPDDGGATQCDLVPHQNYGMFNASGCWSDEFSEPAPVMGFLVEYEIVPLDVEKTNWGRIKALYQ